MSSIRRATSCLVAVACAVLAAMPAGARADIVDRDINDYVLFAYRSFVFKGGSDSPLRGVISGGNVGVNIVDTTPDNSDRPLSFGGRGLMPTNGTQLVGDSIRLASGTNVYDVFANHLAPSTVTDISHGDVVIRNQGPSAFTLATPTEAIIAAANLPTIAAFTIGSTDVTLTNNATQSLAAGSYKDIRLNDGSTLILGSGVYNLNLLDAGKNVTILTAADTVVNIKTILSLNDGAHIGSADTVGAQFNVLALGVNINNTRSVTFSHNAVIYGQFFNPFGDLSLGGNNDLFGRFWSFDISGDANDNITFMPPPTVQVPEPAALTILLLGTVSALRLRRRRAGFILPKAI